MHQRRETPKEAKLKLMQGQACHSAVDVENVMLIYSRSCMSALTNCYGGVDRRSALSRRNGPCSTLSHSIRGRNSNAAFSCRRAGGCRTGRGAGGAARRPGRGGDRICHYGTPVRQQRTAAVHPARDGRHDPPAPGLHCCPPHSIDVRGTRGTESCTRA